MSRLYSLNLRLIGLKVWILYYWPIFWPVSFFSLQSLGYNWFWPLALFDRAHFAMTNAGEVCILITSIFLSVVLLRACWMQGAEKCMEDGNATVCTCNADLCNSGLKRTAGLGLTSLTIVLTILHVSLTALRATIGGHEGVYFWEF